jgi:hypothetical protein
MGLVIYMCKEGELGTVCFLFFFSNEIEEAPYLDSSQAEDSKQYLVI